MNSLRLNCLTSSSLPPAIIGILVVAVVAPVVNVALYLPGIKSTPPAKLNLYGYTCILWSLRIL